jgi:prepilin signal peptidase PulO-like enzyme (type II secretory pathway)
MAIMNKKVWTVFTKDLRASSRSILLINSGLIALMFVFSFLLNKYFLTIPIMDAAVFGIMIILAFSGMFVLWKFVKTVENVSFKKRIPVSKLKIGDVPLNYKIWEGLTEKQLKKIKKSGKDHIWIKEGVRFGPAFPLALAFTILFGDGIVWIINLIS